MPTGPFQSKLSPHHARIVALRACKPPVTYAQIAVILKEEHQLTVHRGTIQHYVRVRGTRSLYSLDTPNDQECAPAEVQKSSGKVPEEVLAHVNRLRQKADSVEEHHQSYLPPDGRLTYKEKP